MQKELVSIITPCYNTGHLIHRLLESVLIQDYPHVEMLVVDDGSTDKTKDVILSYAHRFTQKGYKLDYQYQENGGQSVAINNAIKWVKGEYLLWPDADDFYNRADAVSSYVNQFHNLPEDYGMVKSIPKYVDENDLHDISKVVYIDISEWQFDNALFNRNFPWAAYMVRMSAFDITNPFREIYTNKKAGQNWQMVLPLLYSYKCYTIEESLFSVLVRTGSHSRQNFEVLDDIISHISVYEDTILHTLDQINEMPKEEKDEYKRKIRLKYAREKFSISCGFRNFESAKTYKRVIEKNKGTLTIKDHIKYILVRQPYLYSLFQKNGVK